MFLPGGWTDLSLPQGTGQDQSLHCCGSSCGIYCGLLPDRQLCDDLPACIRVSPDMHNCCAGGALENRITRFFSNISMVIYLSHMVLFRVIERLGLNTRFGNGWLQYLITVALVLVATAVFAVVMKKVIYIAESKIPALLAAKSK